MTLISYPLTHDSLVNDPWKIHFFLIYCILSFLSSETIIHKQCIDASVHLCADHDYEGHVLSPSKESEWSLTEQLKTRLPVSSSNFLLALESFFKDRALVRFTTQNQD